MLLMIDNYDSFTYNLVQYFGELGEDIEVFRNDKISIPEIEKLDPEVLVISPGPGTPQDAGISLDVIQHFAGKIPSTWGLSGTSVHWRIIRRQDSFSTNPHAR